MIVKTSCATRLRSLLDDRVVRLMPDTLYYVIEISPEYYRVIDDGGETILYERYLFEVVDPRIPAGWTRTVFPEDD